MHVLGIEREGIPGLFTIIDQNTPSYTEPNWESNVGVIIYPAASSFVAYITLAFGSITAAVRYFLFFF